MWIFAREKLEMTQTMRDFIQRYFFGNFSFYIISLSIFFSCCEELELLETLADEASFYGNHLILEQMKNKAQVLPLRSLMTNTINSDSFKAVSIMKTILEDNKVPVTQDMINLALERKLTDVVETLLPGKYDMEQRKNNYMIKDKENDNITGR